jgi:hypothetical protein
MIVTKKNMKVTFYVANLLFWEGGSLIDGKIVGFYAPVYFGFSGSLKAIVQIIQARTPEELNCFQKSKYSPGQLVAIDVDETWETL